MKLVDKALELAKGKRINQAELARMIGAPTSRLSEWKRDVGRPSIEQGLRLARALGTSLDYLADDEMAGPPPAAAALEADEQAVLYTYRAVRGVVTPEAACNALHYAAIHAREPAPEVLPQEEARRLMDLAEEARRRGENGGPPGRLKRRV